MNKEKLVVKIINKSKYPVPEYATTGSAGCDLRANIDDNVIIKAGERLIIPTGLYIELPEGYEAQIRSRSGMTINHGIVVANGVGTIDSDFRGEISVILLNVSNEDYSVASGEKIAQMIISKYEQAVFEECEALDETKRGGGGFGHSGKL